MYKHLTLLMLLPLLLTACTSMERSGPPAPIVDVQGAPPPAPAVKIAPAEPKPQAPAAPAPTRVYAYTPPETISDTPTESTPTNNPAASAAAPSVAATPSAPAAPASSAPKPATQTQQPATQAQTAARPEREPTTQNPASGQAAASPPSSTTSQTAQSGAATPPPTGPAAPATPEPAPAAPSAPPAPEVASAAPAGGLAPNDMPPAVASLAQRAEQQRQSGDSGGAAATLERALRIQPQEAYLWNRLARVRLEQGMSDSAAKLASRSNALTGDAPALKTNNWEIIATARRQSGDIEGAVEAERKAAGG
ncbi:hypothetical protein CKO42_06820 [Lamprobacter modestohalophilus]|uniref:Tetratricopeptide repeat protein n=1 Tax=Lamprobacter modestohalophilus TaxID=1064514 RepID=A0A9X0W7E6_9GAMM|nr:tetratricopeptide repeat protein [Lamprobacter modestohalophilus]MBK1618161.1 hypothetical protein [Lamprobacter modestohalophilus]